MIHKWYILTTNILEQVLFWGFCQINYHNSNCQILNYFRNSHPNSLWRYYLLSKTMLRCLKSLQFDNSTDLLIVRNLRNFWSYIRREFLKNKLTYQKRSMSPMAPPARFIDSKLKAYLNYSTTCYIWSMAKSFENQKRDSGRNMQW